MKGWEPYNVTDTYSQYQLSVCNKMFPMFSPWILGQIGLPMTVLECAHHEDSKTPNTCLIWLSFDWDIQGRRQGSISEEKVIEKTLTFEMWIIVFNLE